jgi:hypothetical protein
MELPKNVKVIVLADKDVAIMKGLQTLHVMEEKISPLLEVFDMMKVALATLVFKDAKDGEYKIELDDKHSAVFTMKDGEFDYEMTCDCEHAEGEDAPHNSVRTERV